MEREPSVSAGGSVAFYQSRAHNGRMKTILSVSQLTGYIKDLFDTDPMLSDVWLRGEVSNWARARSGHCYFTLKDAGAELRCVMWRSLARRLLVLPQDGDEIVARGRVTVYLQRGQYQFYVEEVEPIGQGVLFRRFEALKQRLREEGLFDRERKRPLPSFPRQIGVVTSPEAAALRDILNVLRRRYPLARVILSPTLVQGNDASPQIAAAIKSFRHVDVDLIIVARGGGSLEDLWAFNEEVVARAIYDAHVPIISGVGHETDVTIADYVADHRAPTPSAAAELAVKDVRELVDGVQGMRRRLDHLIEGRLFDARQQLEHGWRVLERLSPVSEIAQTRKDVQALSAQMTRRMKSLVELKGARVDGLRGRLSELDPQATLARGYAAVTLCSTGRLVRAPADVASDERLTITVQHGEFPAIAHTDGAEQKKETNERPGT